MEQNELRIKESNDNMDLVRMQTEVALIESMAKSKTLTALVVVGIAAFTVFVYFLFNS